MRLGWLVNNFADPHIRLTKDQRRETLRIVHERHLRGRLLAFSAFVVTPPLVLALWMSGVVDSWIAAQLGVSRGTVNMVIVAMIVLATWPWSAWAYGKLYTKPFRRALREGGVRVCVGCGYMLDGIDRPGICPECGRHETEPLGGSGGRLSANAEDERTETDAEQGNHR